MSTVDGEACSGAGARRRGAGLLLCVVFVVASCVTHDSPGYARADSASKQRNQARYAPSRDEGLGASVAILVDNSGSMMEHAHRDQAAKYMVAREAIEAMLASTDSFVARQPGFPVNVGLYVFSSTVSRLVPIRPYDRDVLRGALEGMRPPRGGTAIGTAMEVAVADLYRAGTIRKYILVVTDGENTEGRGPHAVAKEIALRSEGGVRLYFVAFDVDAKRFAFLRDVNGEVLGARDGIALRASLDTIYRGRILAEAVNAGETMPPTKKSP
jgi:Mg-chelatase subunit ChlD